jgi:hypothetical protein
LAAAFRFDSTPHYVSFAAALSSDITPPRAQDRVGLRVVNLLWPPTVGWSQSDPMQN